MTDAWKPPAADVPWIASIGHSDHAVEVFLALLHQNGVRHVVDVRSRPVSHHTQYDQAALRDTLQGHGFHYHHLPRLGGKRDVPYVEHMRTAAFAAGLERLKEIAFQALHDGGTAAFLCVERDPGACHRRFIARRLEHDGWRVHHILPDVSQARLF